VRAVLEKEVRMREITVTPETVMPAVPERGKEVI
jgi:hypothetical protein